MAVIACLELHVFSAHAEVVPRTPPPQTGGPGILRARGGSSKARSIANAFETYSPRTRR